MPPPNHRSALVDASAACAILGLSREELARAVDSGRLLWVWDFSSGGRPLLRYWVGELFSPGPRARHLHPDHVFGCIAGPGSHINRRQAEDVLSLHRATLYDLVKSGGLNWIGPHCFHRQQLIDFLRRRWLGRRAETKSTNDKQS